MATPFVTKLVQLTQKEHDDFHLDDENDPNLTAEIKRFWKELGLPFPGVNTPWSAVFVSDCMKRAGATPAEFKFSAAHAVFVHAAIANGKAGTGVFQAFPIDQAKPQPGDIIQNNRGGQKVTFSFAAKSSSYASHSAIVVKIDGGFALTIGGNESDSIRMKRVPLDGNGFVEQRKSNPFICVIKNLK